MLPGMRLSSSNVGSGALGLGLPDSLIVRIVTNNVVEVEKSLPKRSIKGRN